MTLRHLKIFVEVCSCGSITAAGEKLYLAQPSVSLAVRELEEYYGVKLFDRISNRLHITPQGSLLQEYALHIVSLFDEMENRLRNCDAVGRLRVGASITIGNYLLPRCARLLTEEYPGIAVESSIQNSGTIEEKLLKNELDVAFIERAPHSKALRAETLPGDPLAVVCGPKHRLAGKSAALTELAEEKLILRERGSAGREIFDALLSLHGLEIEPAWESASTQAIVRAVAEGLGVSVLPLLLVQRDLASGLLRQIEVAGVTLTRDYYAVYHKNKFLTRSALFLLQQMKREAEEAGKTRYFTDKTEKKRPY